MKSVIEHVLDITLSPGQALRFSHKSRARAIHGARVFLKTLQPHRKLSLDYFSRSWFYESKESKISRKRHMKYVGSWRSPYISSGKATVKQLLYALSQLEVMP